MHGTNINYRYIWDVSMASLSDIVIHPKRIYNLCLFHALLCDIATCFATLLCHFTHISTNLLTQCTQCQFLSADICKLQVFTHIYRSQKIPEKTYKKISVQEPSRVPKESCGGSRSHPGGKVVRPPPGRATRAPRRCGHPLVPSFGLQ